MSKNTVLILSYSYLISDPRVQRQIAALKNDFEIETCARGDSGVKSIPFYLIYALPPSSLLRKLKRLFQFMFRKYELYYWDNFRKKLATELRGKKYAVVISNDILSLPLAVAIAGDNSRIYFDAHEYHPKEFEDNLKWMLLNKRYFSFLCKKYIPKVQAFSTVSEKIANEYKNFTGVLPVVITNASLYHNLAPAPITNRHIRLIHHGAAITSRKIELMIKMAKLLDERFVMDFILVGNDTGYINHLKSLSGNSPRIRFPEPVEADNICRFINAYDLGIFLLPPTNFNYLNALPNKLFEFVQARLGIVVSPNPEMAKLINKHNLGVVSEDYTSESMANAINKLNAEQITGFKKNSDSSARILSAEENMKKINSIVSELVSHSK